MSNQTRTIKTKNATDIINVTREIGDSLASKYWETNDLKVSSATLDAYKVSLSTAKAQVIYKKIVGRPARIAFFE